MKRSIATVFLLLGGTALTLGHAQTPCAVPDHLPPARLSGLWTVSFSPEGAATLAPASHGVVMFERHPEFAGGVRGRLQRSGADADWLAVLSGDVTDGEFHLDESTDGQTLSGVWSGTAQDCGGRLTVTGTRRLVEGQATGETVMRFRLEKAPGWR